jgi:hypothetical protein
MLAETTNDGTHFDKHATSALQACNTRATSMQQAWYKHSTSMQQAFNKHATTIQHGFIIKGVLRVFQGCSKGVTRV